MTYKKAYIIVRNTIFTLMILMFITIDAVILYYRDFILYLLFIPLEALFIFLWWLILVKINKNAVVHINTNKGKIEIITLGKNYRTTADKIKVQKGSFFCYLYFESNKLRANSSNKSVHSFLYKYRNIYRVVKK